jgi:lysophospholipase L1-like esterase
VTGPSGAPTRWRPFRTAVIAAVAGLVAAGCAGGTTSVTPPAEVHVHPYTYVAIGGSESVGYDANDPVRQAFPVLLDQKLPHQTAFYDLAVPEASAADVLAHQEAAAVALHPNLVTVWVGINDVEEGVSPTAFGRELQEIVAPLRAHHAQVLLANLESITDAPTYGACVGTSRLSPGSNHRCFVDNQFATGMVPPAKSTNAILAAYDAQVADVAHSDGAVLVHIDGAFAQAETEDSSPFSPDDFDLSTAGHAVAARLFVQAWRSTGVASRLK